MIIISDRLKRGEMVSVWICRAGKRGVYHQLFVEEKRIYLAWAGLDKDLRSFCDEVALKNFVAAECDDNTATAISTHWNQVHIFASKMQTGDYVITPSCSAGQYSIGLITSDYNYVCDSHLFHHYRTVSWLLHDVERKNFSVKMQHTLGAYRTVFQLKDDAEFHTFINRSFAERM